MGIPSTRKRRARTKRKPEEFVIYVLELQHWDYYFSFRANDPSSRLDDGPYSVLSTAELKGNLIRPENGKHSIADITLSSRPGMLDEPRPTKQGSIGSLRSEDDHLSAYIFLPDERFAEVLTVLVSDRVKATHFVATRLRYNSALVMNVTLLTSLDEEEW